MVNQISLSFSSITPPLSSNSEYTSRVANCHKNILMFFKYRQYLQPHNWNDISFLCSPSVAAGLVRTKESVCHYTRRTAMYAFVKTDSLGKTAKQVRNVVLDPIWDNEERPFFPKFSTQKITLFLCQSKFQLTAEKSASYLYVFSNMFLESKYWAEW